MNLSRFLEHWSIVENPFRGEEARQDAVFLRLGGAGAPGGAARVFDAGNVPTGASGGAGRLDRTVHSDFEKIAGDFARPSAAIVFGEKGSGKTAIRIQLAERVAGHNAAHPESRCLLVAFDDLNPALDRFFERMSGDRKATVADILGKLRLVDHIDAIIMQVVPPIVDVLLREQPGGDGADRIDLGPEARKAVRKWDAALRRDLLLLQALYDRPERAEERTRRLRRRLRLPMDGSVVLWRTLALAGWLLPVGVLSMFYVQGTRSLGELNVTQESLLGAAALVWAVALVKRLAWDRLAVVRLAHRIRRQIRVSTRGHISYARSLRELSASARDAAVLPTGASDDARYAMLDRLRGVLRAFGYATMMVVVDRVDEPTIVSGDPDRMQAVVWPLLNNKFLQQPGVGVKLLLPIELRHSLFRESAAFFQEARLDKQNLIERLNWSGSMLYDLCNARLQACLAGPAANTEGGGGAGAEGDGAGGKRTVLLDLFAEDVTPQDIVDALDQMHQPRDAFKMLYQCMTEHCSNVTEEQQQWRIPRLVLEHVRKEQAERVRQLYRGMRPA